MRVYFIPVREALTVLILALGCVGCVAWFLIRWAILWGG